MAPLPPPLQSSDELTPFPSFNSLLPEDMPEDIRLEIGDVGCVGDACASSLADLDFSATALGVMNLIVAIAVLACVFETLSMMSRWCKRHPKPRSSPPLSAILNVLPEGSLQGHSRHASHSTLTAPETRDREYSPGVEKKTAAYAVQEKERRRLELEGEDDEMNWPIL